MKRFLTLAVATALSFALIGCNNASKTGESEGTTTQNTNSGGSSDKITIGFLVKSAAEPWFQAEWQFADEASAKYGFELIKKEVKDGTAVMKELDNLGAQKAQGVIICTPDQSLGDAIVKKTNEYGMKLYTVDDQLFGADKKPLTDVHHLGIQAKDIGKMVGQGLVDEMKKRGWDMKQVGALALTFEEVETTKLRTEGAIEVLTANGFPTENIFKSPWKKPNTINDAMTAARPIFTQHPEKKFWVIFSSNDDGVLGGVRASEERQIPASNVIGIGINGTTAVDDFKKSQPTGMFASVLLSPRRHGFVTAEAMYKWIKDGAEPQKETWTSGILITRDNYVAEMTKEGLIK